MTDHQDKRRSRAEAELEREIRQGRKFTPAEALARMAGPGAMKGGSPVSRVQQAELEIELWLTSHVADTPGALRVMLCRDLKGSELLLNNLDCPLLALTAYCKLVLDSDYRLRELVRDADAEWGRSMGERPYFEREGRPPDPGDPYTVESVRKALSEAVSRLDSAKR
jgi:hypothetical protein